MSTAFMYVGDSDRGRNAGADSFGVCSSKNVFLSRMQAPIGEASPFGVAQNPRMEDKEVEEAPMDVDDVSVSAVVPSLTNESCSIWQV
mmetsp:Transcript_105966/g.167246  ORF Transcript_105966/g.167246 Transcript_105966/m.167246 type:complete len:88 (+) Transcript_105966:176-439(+)